MCSGNQFSNFHKKIIKKMDGPLFFIPKCLKLNTLSILYVNNPVYQNIQMELNDWRTISADRVKDRPVLN